MQVKLNPGIVGEYRNYRDVILSSPPDVIEHDGDVVRLTDRVDLELRSDGSYLSRKALAEGSSVGGGTERIVEHYSYDSIFGVQELAWRIDTEYVAHTEGNRPVIDKISIDGVRNVKLSEEKVDASTGEVIEEWFIADYRQRVLEPTHACKPTSQGNS